MTTAKITGKNSDLIKFIKGTFKCFKESYKKSTKPSQRSKK